jgi:hypothetical protein
MIYHTYQKLLSANDTGETGTHQAGICVPKEDDKLLLFFPRLDPRDFNPDAWIVCEDNLGERWKMRYIYYNGKLHSRNSRNEYRITHITKFLRKWKARSGDYMVLSSTGEAGRYRIEVKSSEHLLRVREDPPHGVIVLRGWSRVY